MHVLLFPHKQKTGLPYDTIPNAPKVITNFHSSRPPLSSECSRTEFPTCLDEYLGVVTSQQIINHLYVYNKL
jgi:hypothetical protein